MNFIFIMFNVFDEVKTMVSFSSSFCDHQVVILIVECEWEFISYWDSSLIPSALVCAAL